MLKKCCGAVLLFSVSTLPAWAHDVWLEPAGKDMRLVFGHPGELEPYEPKRTESVVGVSRDGKRQQLGSHVHGDALIVQPAADTSVILIAYDYGFLTETPDEETVNKPKSEVPGYLSAAHARNLHKTLVSWSAAAGKPAGVEFEIVPLANPLAMKPGDELPVQVFYDSKPLADAEIEILGSMDLYITDAEGKVTLPISEPGFQYIQSMHTVPLTDNPDADEFSLTANLTFTL